jgi:hypothetical protein
MPITMTVVTRTINKMILYSDVIVVGKGERGQEKELTRKNTVDHLTGYL